MPVLRYLKKPRHSCISIPKCNVRQQNIEIKRWMQAHPKQVVYLEEGVSTDKYRQFNHQKSK